MNPTVTSIDLVYALYWNCMVLVLVNVILSGLAILFGWRSAYWRARTESLEQELESMRRDGNQDEPTPLNPLPTIRRPPVPKMSDLRRIPAIKFPKRVPSPPPLD